MRLKRYDADSDRNSISHTGRAMIPRYSNAAVTELSADLNKLLGWQEVELAVIAAWAERRGRVNGGRVKTRLRDLS